MNKQTENIDFLIRRLALLVFFMFVLFAFNGTDTFQESGFDNSTLSEITLKIDPSAMLVEAISYPSFDSYFATCELISVPSSNNPSLQLIASNTKTNLLFQLSFKKFLKIKPHLAAINTCHFISSNKNEDIPLIS